ncbi:MAG: hypothetical protein NZ921_03205 [Candidatus Caldarchaeum sp.]|nr:hypothetical protein [Candidatus Caldarchaeum sp.]
MKRASIPMFLLVLLIMPSALGDGFSSVVDEGKLKISLSYPVEVRVGSCFTVSFQVTFLSSISVSKLRLTLTYVTEAGSTTILSDTIINTPTSFMSGNVITKAYTVCIPTAVRRDPLVTATVFANYTRDGTYKPLTHNWYLATVRNRTYEDIERDLAQAQNQISTLQRNINDLQNEINRLRTRIEEILWEAGRLASSLESSRREYERLEQRFQNLSNEYRILNERYVSTLGDLRSLQALYENLRRENTALMENYRQLLSDYRNLTKEFNMLQASYNQLKTIHENLSSRHEEAKRQIGYLQSQLDQTNRELGEIRLRYKLLGEENILHRNLMFAEAFIILGLVTAVVTYALSRRTRKLSQTFPALPPPPPPPPQD